jgi:hypothetical protein
MSDPQRLLSDASADPMGRLLIESWQQEGPPADGRARTLAALGIVSTAATVGATASLGSIAPKSVASLSMIKWIGLAAIVSVATLGVAIYTMHSSSNINIHVSAVSPANNPSTTDPRPNVVTPLPSASAFEISDSKPAPTNAAARRIVKTNESVHTGDRLSEQIATIDAARHALSSGDDAHAETLATDYESKFPHGTFVEEAEAIRITALSQNGDMAKARILGAAFLQAHPSSSYAPRIKTIIDGTNR